MTSGTTVEGLRNLRDLGGLKTADASRTRPGVVFRSEAPCLSNEAAALLSGLGLRSVIDLREPAEAAKAPTTTPDQAVVLNIPIPEPHDQDGRTVSERFSAGRSAPLVARSWAGC